MPFCQACSKAVEAEWKLCPFCGHSLHSEADRSNVQDSVVVVDIIKSKLSNIVSDLITDTAVAGDVHQNITINDANYAQNASDARITCKQCGSTGNFTLFVCNRKNISCTETFCEHCKSNSHPKKCSKCIQEILHQQQLSLELHREQQANLRLEADRKIQEQAETLKVHEWLLSKIKAEKYATKPAVIFRYRIIILPLLQIICLYLLLKSKLVELPENDIATQFGMVIFSLLLTGYIIMKSVFKEEDIDYIKLAEEGYAPKRAIVAVLSPVISMILVLISVGLFGTNLLTWIAYGTGGLAILVVITLFQG